MTPGETAAAIAALAIGIYLIAASLGAVQLAVNHLVGLAVAVFGAAYILAGHTKESAFWGGLLSILGVAVAAGGGAPPLFVVGVVLVFIALFALAAGRR